MNKNIKNILIGLIPISLLIASILAYPKNGSSSSSNETSTQANDDSSSQTTDLNSGQTSTDQSGSSSSAISQEQIQTKTLSVDSNRCRGCGRCVMIDSEHFQMSGRIAQVTSQNNLDSSSLSTAINSCPASAINLN